MPNQASPTGLNNGVKCKEKLIVIEIKFREKEEKVLFAVDTEKKKTINLFRVLPILN